MTLARVTLAGKVERSEQIALPEPLGDSAALSEQALLIATADNASVCGVPLAGM